MAVIKLPAVELPTGSTQEQILYLTNLVQQYKKSLEYFIEHIDSANVTDLDARIVRITGLTVGSNVSIGDALTPVENAIATKNGVFRTQPVPPYTLGDLWADGEELKMCITGRETGAFVGTDWTLATGYKTATGVTTIIDGRITTDYLEAIGITAESIKSGVISAQYICTDIGQVNKLLIIGDASDSTGETKTLRFYNNANSSYCAYIEARRENYPTDKYTKLVIAAYDIAFSSFNRPKWGSQSFAMTDDNVVAKFG